MNHDQARRAARRHDSVRRSAVAACEQLEARQLLSTINWTNRGTTDNFGIYGGNAATARAIVDRAIDDWERVIVDFNFATAPTNTYNVQFFAGPISGRGVTNNIFIDAAGDPRSSDITMDDNGGGAGWYFDPVIGTALVPDDGEFTQLSGPFEAGFTGAGAAADDNDFYRTAVHELGHAMGIFVNNGGLIGPGTASILGFQTNTGVADPNGGTIVTFNVGGGAIEATFTTSGGGHFYEGPALAALPNNPIHPNELMNAGRTVDPPPTTRQLISNLDATVLAQAYGYTVALPGTINTFYANLNTTTNVLTINGDANPSGSDVDILDINQNGAGTQFLLAGTSETVGNADYTTLNVNLGLANDDVDVNYLPSGKTVAVNLGDGNDRADITPLGNDIDTNVLSNLSVNGGVGTDTITFHDTGDGAGADTWTITGTSVAKSTRTINYANIALLDVNGSAQPTVYNIDGTSAVAALDIVAGAANDTFNVGGGDFDTNLGGAISINGGGGSNPMTVDDTLDGLTGDVYDFDAAQFSKPGQVLTFSNLGSISVLGSPSPSTYRINATAIPITVSAGDDDDVFRVGDAVGSVGAGADDISAIVSLNGAGGADQFLVGNGDLDEFSATIIINGGGAGGGLNNSLVVNDTADTGADPYVLVDGLLTKPGAGSFVGLNYSFINSTLIDMNPGANTFDFTNGFGFPTLQGNGGADTFNVISSAGGAQTPTIRGGAGLDNVIVNEDEVGTATAVFDQDEDLNQLYLYEGSTVNVAANGNTGIAATTTGFLRGILNLNNNFLVTGSSTSFVVDKIARGYNGGAWNGVPAGGASGVVRSATAASSAAADALGYAEVGAAAGQLNIASYRGTPVAAGDLIVSYTLYGDNNLDRTVNIGDFANLAANFNLPGTNWVRGNYNYDGTTGIADFSLLAANFNLSVAAPAAERPASPAGSIFGSTRVAAEPEDVLVSLDDRDAGANSLPA